MARRTVGDLAKQGQVVKSRATLAAEKEARLAEQNRTKARHLGADCDVCPLRDLPTYSPPHLGAHSDILIVGEAPGKDEVGVGPFRGAAGRVLQRLWTQAGQGEVFERADITNAALCRPTTAPKGNEKPPKEAVAACKGHLDRLVENHRVIVPMGAIAVGAILPEKTTMKEARLGPPKEVDGRTVIPTWHPAYTFHQASAERDIVRDLAKVGADAQEYVIPRVEIYDDEDSAVALLSARIKDPVGLPMALDIETAGSTASAMNRPTRLRSVQLAWDPDTAHVIGEQALKSDTVRAWLERVLWRVRIITHNGQFDIPALRFLGFNVPRIGGDSLLAAHLLDSRRGILRNLEHLSRDLLGAPEWKWLAHMKTHLGDQRKAYAHILSPVPTPFPGLPDSEWQGLVYEGISLRAYARKHPDYQALKASVEAARKDARLRDREKDKLEKFYTTALEPYGITRDEYLGVLATKQGNIYDVAPARPLYIYGGYDAVNTFRIAAILESELREAGMWETYEMVLRGSDMLGMAEQRGIQPSLARMSETRLELNQETERVLAQIQGMGLKSPGSAPQIKVWFGERGWRLDSTDEDHLNDIIDGRYIDAKVEASLRPEVQAMAAAILKYRKSSKLVGTYIDAITTGKGKKAPLLDRRSGRVHPSQKLWATETGRAASSNPNIHNQPKPVRKLYVAGEGKTFVQMDFSAIEFRVIVVESGDETAIALLRQGTDIPSWLGGVVYGDAWLRRYQELAPLDDAGTMPPELETEWSRYYYDRRRMKTVLYGGWYGRQAPAVSVEIGSTIEEAERILTTMFTTFPKMVRWQQRIRTTVENGEELRTFWGRRYPYARGQRGYALEKVVRGAWAFKPQGTATDINLMTATALHEEGWPILVLVHDSILMEPEIERAQEAIAACHRVAKAVGRRYTDLIDFKIEVKTGPDWYSVS